MNGKTVTMLRRWATLNKAPFRAVKRLWKDTPRDKRPALRMKALTQIRDDGDNFEIVTTPTGRTLLLSKNRVS